MATKTQIEKKAQVLEALIGARQALLALASGLPADAGERIFLGTWSANDLVAHLAGWDETNLAAAQQVMAGELPAFYALHDTDWRSYNAALVGKHKRDSLDETVMVAQETHRRLVEFLQAVPAEAFNKDFGVRFRGYKFTIQRLLEAETKDEQTHHEQLEDFRRSIAEPGPEG